jgi:hypothetical protein
MYKSLQLRVKLNHSPDHVTDRNEKYGYEGRVLLFTLHGYHSAFYQMGR